LHTGRIVLPGPRRITILVVEDDIRLRTFYRTVLVAAGYRVVSADDGIQALRYVEFECPDAVVLDIGLPRLGGRDVQREIASHAETCNIPIIVVSGTDTSDLNRDEFACLLRKPISADTLLAAVSESLHRRIPGPEPT
jgi:DNA-binding response OmpR family regulator